MFFVYNVLALVFTTVNLLSYRAAPLSSMVGLLASSLMLLVSLYAIIVICCKQQLSTAMIVTVLYATCAVMLAWDLQSRTLARASWPLLVVVVDMLLVMQVPARFTLQLVVVTVIWIVVLAVEEGFRFGLFDLPGMRSQETRREYFEQLTDCATLPCASGFPPKGLIAAVCVFITDFVVTRGFARDVLKEQRSMERTISIVQEIASLLAGYDVEGVAEMLEAHREELPEGMIGALRGLEENLRSYKAYLPKTCLPFEEDSQSIVNGELSGSLSSGSSFVMKSTPRLGLTSVKTTLLTVNVKGTLRLIEEDCARFSQLFTALLLKTLKASGTNLGMVDMFIGDRIHCSFNASKQCFSHATSALRTAATMRGSTLSSQANIGVATGKVLRGDMGCDVMRRFSMVGPLVRDVHGMERAGRIFGCDVLCNRLCFSEAECEHDLRLIPCKVEVAADCEPETVAELLIPDELEGVTAVDEWMYMIGGKKEWEEYNFTVRKYLRGEASAEAVDNAALSGECARVPTNVSPGNVKGNVLRLHQNVAEHTRVWKVSLSQ